MTRAIRSQVVFVTLVTLLSLSLVGLGSFTIFNLANRNVLLNEQIAQQNDLLGQAYDDLHASQVNAQRLYDQLSDLPGVEPDGENPATVSPAPGVAGERGSTGERGERGVQGEPGADGPPGTPGADGRPGVDGVDGQDGEDGVDGQDGADGQQGVPGEPGQSAFPFTFTFTTTDVLGQEVPRTCVVTSPTEATCT